jgi:hypothetical protein
MPEIRPEEISLAVCDAAGWSVTAECDPCKLLGVVQLEQARGRAAYRRPILHLLNDAKPHFRCRRCGWPSEAVFVSRPGDGQVAELRARHVRA